jgi:glyoxylase-like metal-dependent hydrolase (beta-lactamase superfamily II)
MHSNKHRHPVKHPNWISGMKFSPTVHAIYDPATSSVQYVVADQDTRSCIIIDPVLDFDEKAGSITTINADTMLELIADLDYRLEFVLDTHPHADHFSAASYLRDRTGVPIGIGEKIVDVQKLWNNIYNRPDSPTDGSQWDRLFSNGETFTAGSFDISVIFSPGHTMASVTYLIGDAAFVHDTLFMPDSGTARCDFPGGSADALWHSINLILSLPDETRIFTGHDYQPGGRAPLWESSVAEQRGTNIHMSRYLSQESFVNAREMRDRILPMPRLILPAMQVNTNAGRLPPAENNGRSYLKIPVGFFDTAPR